MLRGHEDEVSQANISAAFGTSHHLQQSSGSDWSGIVILVIHTTDKKNIICVNVQNEHVCLCENT